MKRVLVTGFEPFGGSDVNVSMDITRALPREKTSPNPWIGLRGHTHSIQVSIETQILSVDEHGSRMVADQLMSGTNWDAILHLGVCGECTVPRLETLARDALDMRIPDNAGRQIVTSLLSGKGDLRSTAPVKHWLQTWKPEVELSENAGAYLCNETLYRTLETGKVAETPTLFVHLPSAETHPFDKSLRLVQSIIDRLVHTPVLKVAGALLIHEQKFLVARRAAHERHSGTWEFPGGKLEPDEQPSQAIMREMDEEFGWNVTALDSVGTWFHELPLTVIALEVIHCTFVGDFPSFEPHPRWTSHDRVEWHTIESAQNLTFTGSDKDVLLRLQSEGWLN